MTEGIDNFKSRDPSTGYGHSPFSSLQDQHGYPSNVYSMHGYSSFPGQNEYPSTQGQQVHPGPAPPGLHSAAPGQPVHPGIPGQSVQPLPAGQPVQPGPGPSTHPGVLPQEGQYQKDYPGSGSMSSGYRNPENIAASRTVEMYSAPPQQYAQVLSTCCTFHVSLHTCPNVTTPAHKSPHKLHLVQLIHVVHTSKCISATPDLSACKLNLPGPPHILYCITNPK